MSSPIGHSLTGLTIFSLDDTALLPNWRKVWAGWLILLSVIPDIDYFISALRLPPRHTIRITHSFLGVLFLPLVTVVLLFLLGYRGNRLKVMSAQAIWAGFSHIILDLLVAENPEPLLWPLSMQTYIFPFGILPGSPRLRLSNYLSYGNLLIEVGVLAPLLSAIHLVHRGLYVSVFQKTRIFLLLVISTIFMIWAFLLPR